jgi:hypothetical protein
VYVFLRGGLVISGRFGWPQHNHYVINRAVADHSGAEPSLYEKRLVSRLKFLLCGERVERGPEEA